MTLAKRVMDITLALLLSLVLLPVIVIISVLILLREGRPVLYLSERMKTPEQGFLLWKFRTMAVAETDSGVSGGDKSARITPIGARLRRYRLDELPQLWNILRGDISFVGPRPPLRRYVDMCPDLYTKVLRNRPGVTGLATIVFHKTEEHLLAPCKTPQETESVYVRRCIPVKGRLDLIYAANQSVCYDAKLIVETIRRVFRRAG